MPSRWTRAGLILIVLSLLTMPAFPAQPNEAGCPSVAVCFTPGENGTQMIVQALGEAKQTIQAQAYSCTSAPIAKALLGLFVQRPKRIYSSMGALGMGKVGMTTGI